jgi:hypothetical protein
MPNGIALDIDPMEPSEPLGAEHRDATSRQQMINGDRSASLPVPSRSRVGGVAVVVNHLHLSDALTEETAHRDYAPRIVDAGATAAQVLRVDDTHLVLILEFASAQDADRVAAQVGGTWMREHIVPLLARGPQRSVGEVVASATA